jgi:hypothetical protein
MKIDKTGLTLPKTDEYGNLYMLKIIDAENNTVKLTPESQGYTKTLDVTVVFSRTYIDPVSITEKQGFFRQVLKLSFDNPKTSKFSYFYFDPKIQQNVCVKDFNNGFCQNISLNKPTNPEDYRIYEIKYGKITRITKETAIKLLQSKEALMFDSESLDSTTVLRVKV